MKVIDLLNKIANGEDVPNTIIVVGEEEDKYYYNKDLKEYINQKTGEKLFEDGYGKYLKYYLNDIVEIIEDTPKEDKKIEKLGAFNIKKFYDDYPETANFILEMFKKQEEIIDRLNGDK